MRKLIFVLLLFISPMLLGFDDPLPPKPILIQFTAVPDLLAKRGLGPKELGASLAQVLDSMANGGGNVSVDRGSPQALPELIVGEGGEKEVFQYSKIVDGEVSFTDPVIVLKITVKDIKTGETATEQYSGDPGDINILLSKSGEKTLALIHPYSYAVYLYDSYRIEEALKQINQIIKTGSSDSAFAYNLWGLSFKDRGDNAHAIEKFKEAVKIWPGYSNAYMNIGNAYYGLDDSVQGAAMMEKAVSVNPKNWLAYDNWSGDLYAKKDYEGAAAKCQKLIELRPFYAAGYNRMGLALSDGGKNQEALAYYEKAVQLNPDFAFAYGNWSMSLLDLGQYGPAEEKIKACLNLEPNNAVYINDYGLIFLRSKRYSEAIDKFEEALKLDPSYEHAEQNLLLAKEHLGK